MINDQFFTSGDDKGFIFTLDAVLALIPVFIVLTAVSSVDPGSLILPSQQVRISNQAQDTLDAMAQYPNTDNSLLEEMAMALKANDNDASAAKEVIQVFMDKNLPGMNYELVEINQLKGDTIISRGDRNTAQNVAVGSKNYGNYSFKLYVWD